jgi:hypothetical protein
MRVAGSRMLEAVESLDYWSGEPVQLALFGERDGESVIFLIGLLLLVLSGCSSSDAPAPSAASPSESELELPSQSELIQNTEDIAVMLCKDDGPALTAKTYGVKDVSDLDAIALSYSLDSAEGPHRAAAYRGCLKGLTQSSKP